MFPWDLTNTWNNHGLALESAQVSVSHKANGAAACDGRPPVARTRLRSFFCSSMFFPGIDCVRSYWSRDQSSQQEVQEVLELLLIAPPPLTPFAPSVAVLWTSCWIPV